MSAPTDAGARQKVVPAQAKPCSQCPWRTANQGQPHPHGFYTKANLRRLWAGLRRGERMTCHPTDPCMAEFEGYENTANRGRTHECAGALILIQRELARFGVACKDADADGAKDALSRYRKAHPKGMLREGLETFVWTLATRGGAHGLALAAVKIGDPDVSHPDLEPWADTELERAIELNVLKPEDR